MKKVVVIGGGVAGLSAGIYSVMNGFDTEILEMHTVAGGQCTAWERKGYRFDYCLHWLVGTSKGAFHDIWKETNVINDQTEIIDHDIHSKIINSEEGEFIIYSDIDRWERYLIEFAPEDAVSIRRMCNHMRKSAVLEPFALPPELRYPLDYIRILPAMIPLMILIKKFGRLTAGEYFDKLKFRNTKLKTVFRLMYGERNFSALAFIFMLAWFNQKNAGYIKGGSYPLARRMAEKFERLGGKISYRKRVGKIIVENNVAKGVLLEDGSIIMADYVIGTADGYTTIYKMLDGKYVSRKINHAYTNWELFTPLVQVSFGINKAIPSEAPIIIKISKSLKIGSTPLENGFSVMNYSYDSTMAPEGKTTIVLRYESPWKIWENLDGDDYKNEKKQIEKDAITCLESIYPGISGHIEVTDVATPLTNVRFTGVKNGAYEGFMPSKENMMKSLGMQLPKLKNFYMAGQWIFPGGGLPPSAQSGKWVVQLICRKEKRKFTADR
ncbi:MAG: NAD(P)/FAD-dependent oxidoreductase [Bacteroidales bacterium]|nr:NAD(P)/FAD-dependent oxidoreductase [Bacteroidales bacterium]